MVADPKPRFFTPEEYLRLERDAEVRSEYENGVIVAMSGGTPEHDLITGNIFGELRAQLKGKPCVPHTDNMRVWMPACNRYYYPDMSVACDPQYQILDGVANLINPVVIVEVLSPSTEGHDRGPKRDCYQTIPSLAAYILVAQDRPFVEVFTRLEDGDWRVHKLLGLEATLVISAIDCQLPLADIYARVTLPGVQES